MGLQLRPSACMEPEASLKEKDKKRPSGYENPSFLEARQLCPCHREQHELAEWPPFRRSPLGDCCGCFCGGGCGHAHFLDLEFKQGERRPGRCPGRLQCATGDARRTACQWN